MLWPLYWSQHCLHLRTCFQTLLRQLLDQRLWSSPQGPPHAHQWLYCFRLRHRRHDQRPSYWHLPPWTVVQLRCRDLQSHLRARQGRRHRRLSLQLPVQQLSTHLPLLKHHQHGNARQLLLNHSFRLEHLDQRQWCCCLSRGYFHQLLYCRFLLRGHQTHKRVIHRH